MSNVVSIRNGLPIDQRSGLEKAAAVYDRVMGREPPALPSWVTENATLNRVVIDLWSKGWSINILGGGENHTWIECRHHQAKPIGRNFLYLKEAMDVQRMMDAAKAIKF